jgi:hypothetical protein
MSASRSLIYSKNKTGPRTEPCECEEVCSIIFDLHFQTNWIVLVQKHIAWWSLWVRALQQIDPDCSPSILPRKLTNQIYQLMSFQMKTFKLHVHQPTFILQTNHPIPCLCCLLISAESFHSHFWDCIWLTKLNTSITIKFLVNQSILSAISICKWDVMCFPLVHLNRCLCSGLVAVNMQCLLFSAPLSQLIIHLIEIIWYSEVDGITPPPPSPGCQLIYWIGYNGIVEELGFSSLQEKEIFIFSNVQTGFVSLSASSIRGY